VSDKSRLERLDEVFRTLLVVATILAAFSLRTFPEPLISQAFQTLLFLLISLLLWAIAVLGGKHPGAAITRLLSLETLSIAILRTLAKLFVIFPPAGTEMLAVSWGVFVLEGVLPLTMIILGGLYLRLRVLEIVIAFSLGFVLLPAAYLLILRSYPLPQLPLEALPMLPLLLTR
jgi:hypothetical protein